MSDGFSQVVEGEQSPVSNTQAMDCTPNQSRNEISKIYTDGVFSSQSSFGRWNYVNDDSLGSLHGLQFGAPSQNGHFTQKVIFTIMDISPTWAYCTEATKNTVEVAKDLSRTDGKLEGEQTMGNKLPVLQSATVVAVSFAICKVSTSITNHLVYKDVTFLV